MQRNNIMIIENNIIYLSKKQRTQHTTMLRQAKTVNIINSSVVIVEGIAPANYYAFFLYFVRFT